MLTFTDDDLRQKLQDKTGTATVAPSSFYAFSNLEEDVRRQVQKIKSHPWIPDEIPVKGFIFDVKTGNLNPVTE